MLCFCLFNMNYVRVHGHGHGHGPLLLTNGHYWRHCGSTMNIHTTSWLYMVTDIVVVILID